MGNLFSTKSHIGNTSGDKESRLNCIFQKDAKLQLAEGLNLFYNILILKLLFSNVNYLSWPLKNLESFFDS